MYRLDLSGALRLVFIQAVVTGFLVLIAWIFAPQYVLYVLAGGLIATIANAVFAVLVFAKPSSEASASSAKLMGAEMIKLVLTAAMIGAFLWWRKPGGADSALLFMGIFLLIYLLPGVVAQMQSK